MRPLLPALRRLAALTALLGILGQSVLPAAHAWVVDAREAAYHGSAHGGAPRSAARDGQDTGHRHHTDSDCPVCPLYAAARAAAAPGAEAHAAPDFLPAGAASPDPARSDAAVSGTPVRGPPPGASA